MTEQTKSLYRKLKEIYRRLSERAVYPPELAFMLLVPLRNLVLSPKQLVERLELLPHHFVLEVGCGPSYFSSALARAVGAADRSGHPAGNT